MAYDLLISASWLKIFTKLPIKVQKKIATVHKILRTDPYNGRGKSIKIKEGQPQYSNLYRYKLHGYRIFYGIGGNFVRLLDIRIRDDNTYKNLIFNADDMTIGGDASPSMLQIIPTTHWDVQDDAKEKNRKEIQHVEDENDDEAIFYDEHFLKALEIPSEHWSKILLCKTAVDIIDADLPEEIIEKIIDWGQEPIDKIIQEPVYDLPSTEELDKLLKGTIKGFLLKLDPEQENVSRKSLKGPTLVKGGPGTGKSLVALYRIRNLLTPDAQTSLFDEHIPKILFVTYTTTLVEHSKQLLYPLLDKLADNVTISSLDAIARQIIIENGGVYNPAQTDDKHNAFNEAIHVLMQEQKQNMNAIMNIVSKLKFDYIIDEFDWVLEGRNILTKEEYLSENRTGRGLPLDKGSRTLLWDLHDRYVDVLGQKNKKTYNLLRKEALDIYLEGYGSEKILFDSVVIDEAQDLPPIAIKLCLKLCKNKEGIYLTADAGQSIYQRGFSWKRIDEELDIRGRTTILKYNYRSTKQIGACSTQLLNCSSQGDIETRELIPVKEGPTPTLLSCSNNNEHLIKIKAFIDLSLETLELNYDSVAVLAKTNTVVEQINDHLNQSGIPAEIAKGKNLNHDNTKVKVMTLHSAKGLEFPIVIIAKIDRDQIPHLKGVTDPDEKDAVISQERNLLSVGMTRAMRLLAVSYNQQYPSIFINEMDKSLWTVI
ncbi:MAG: ATP-dependent helicase [Desulfobacter sp.]|nr:MAG: ATP-dependent helicase [Desulfobacter sp.]